MSLAIHDDIVPALVRALTQLRHILQKGQAHAEANAWDPAVLLGMRLAPDMIPLTRQVQIATDIVKFAAVRLTGADAPIFEDTETTFAELDARVQRAIDFLGTVPAAAYEGAEDRAVTMPSRAYGELHFDGRSYLLTFVVPNVYFHCSIAYALLRHAGVPLGKLDFIGPVGQR